MASDKTICACGHKEHDHEKDTSVVEANNTVFGHCAHCLCPVFVREVGYYVVEETEDGFYDY